MDCILLNGENTLWVEYRGRVCANGYRERFSLCEGEELRLTDRRAGNRFCAVADGELLLQAPEDLGVWTDGETVYLYLYPRFRAFFRECGAVAEGEEVRFSEGCALPLLLPANRLQKRTVAGKTLYRLQYSVQKGGAEECETRSGGRCVLALLDGDVPLFYGVADGYELREDGFWITRRFADYRRHEARIFRTYDGKIRRYEVRATGVDVLRIPPCIFPLAFAEEVFCRGAVGDFLSQTLLPRAKEIPAFLGNFVKAVAWEDDLLLLGEDHRVSHLRLEVSDHRVFRIQTE